MPIDDASPLLAAAYGGRWDAVVNPSPQLFKGTFHRSDSSDAAFTYTFTGTYVAWLAGSSCCTSVNVSVDGGTAQLVMVTGQRKPFERSRPSPGSAHAHDQRTSGLCARVHGRRNRVALTRARAGRAPPRPAGAVPSDSG